MNASEYTILGKRLSRYEYQLTDCCNTLHSSVCGTGDRLPSSEALTLYNFLIWRLNDWHKSIGWQGAAANPEVYDEAVRKLCEVARNEYLTSGHLEQDIKDFESRCSLCEHEFSKKNPQYVIEGYTIDKHLGYRLHNDCAQKWFSFIDQNKNISAIEAFELLKKGVVLSDPDFKNGHSEGKITQSGLVVPSSEWLENIQSKMNDNNESDWEKRSM